MGEFGWKFPTFRGTALHHLSMACSPAVTKESLRNFLDFMAMILFACSSFLYHQMNLKKPFLWSILTVNFICFGIISICYLIVFIITSTSSSSLSEGVTGDHVRNRNQRLQRKVSIIILTDFLCWVPFIIICLLHTTEVVDASPWYALMSILILPINSVINPLLYDDTIGRMFGRIVRWLRNVTYEGQIAQGVQTAREPAQIAPSILPGVDETTI